MITMKLFLSGTFILDIPNQEFSETCHIIFVEYIDVMHMFWYSFLLQRDAAYKVRYLGTFFGVVGFCTYGLYGLLMAQSTMT